MSANTNPSPAPDSGATPQPELNVVPPPEPQPQSPGLLNKRQTQELTKAAQIGDVASVPAILAVLENHGISAAFLTQFKADIAATRGRSDTAVYCTTVKEGATIDEEVTQKKLLKRLRQIQSAAKQKHLYDDPVVLQDYLVGQPITQSRALMEQSSLTIITKGDTERPPGIDTQFIIDATADRNAYVQSKVTQRADQAEAIGERVTRDQQVESIKQRRVELQLAANTAWPAGVPENAAMRHRFFLQVDRSPSL